MAPDTRSKSIVDATQSRHEWVTPQILEMSAALTDGKPGAIFNSEICDWRCTQGFVNPFNGNTYPGVGPS